MSNHLDYEINKELGECYLFMGELDKAEEYYTKAASSNGIHPDPYMGLATIAVQRGNLDSALDMYQKAADIEKNDKAETGIALVEMELGDTAGAFTRFRTALDINPENVIAIFGMVQIAHAENRLEEVIPYLTTCLEVAPDKDDVRFTLAGCLASLGKHMEAGQHLEIILERDPENASAQELYGQLELAA